MAWRLSKYLLNMADHGDEEDAQDFPEQDRLRRIFRKIADQILKSREGYTEGDWNALERIAIELDRDSIEEQLDEILTRRMLGDMKKMVKRFGNLSRLETMTAPSETTAIYLKEAVRTYVNGLPQASAAMSRAALEQALKEKPGVQGKSVFIKFQDLVTRAKDHKILDSLAEKQARNAAEMANDVLHRNVTDSPGALNILIEVRGVLQHVYSQK